ncbi:glycoside hydrolase family 43 protein [Amycolatopsis sp. CA-126428]|uniref:glycoside hydrolase family 43 protein n=1 Tax=Amycolatopsis sp. CA-126428 TaxID=2073158 RepID=UPI001304F4F2|nr:glycoside hydrolase family 43 protein [Amycolatopsis sp. CA-126428]
MTPRARRRRAKIPVIAADATHAATPITVRNPILPGFHPDPSIVRVGSDYYIANSTFEWFPGIRLHHSSDLVNWEPAGYALTDPAQLDLRGVPDSGGVRAPSLSYDDGHFWLVYAVAYSDRSPFEDLDLFLVIAPAIGGPWSEPRYLGSGGFDPSVFHADGRHWLVRICWTHPPGRPSFAGVVLQELDFAHRRPLGPRQVIHRHGELIEGPNLYRRDGWYYLIFTEGDPPWNHGITVVRSRDIAGPYYPDPNGPLLTSRDNQGLALQKAGHGELVRTGSGEWYLVHIASRPITVAGRRRCMLGRETCLQRVEWDAGGWPRLAHGGHWPEVSVPVPATDRTPRPTTGIDQFGPRSLAGEWNSLRRPISDSWLSLTERPAWLRLRGRQGLHSGGVQSLIAQRLTSDRAVVSTAVQARPKHPGQQAGLVLWYDTGTHIFFGLTAGERGPALVVSTSVEGQYAEHGVDVCCGEDALVHLQATVDRGRVRFAYSEYGAGWSDTGLDLDASVLSDDCGDSQRFTGTFVGLAAHDPVAGTMPADFAYFILWSH